MKFKRGAVDFVALAIFVAITVLIPATVKLTQQRQEIRTKAACDPAECFSDEDCGTEGYRCQLRCCVPPPCVPDCTGAACGEDDGCGGTCSNNCPPQTCDPRCGTFPDCYDCPPPPPCHYDDCIQNCTVCEGIPYNDCYQACFPNTPICGDGYCVGEENCLSCAADCGVCPPPCNHSCENLCYPQKNACEEVCNNPCPPPLPFCPSGPGDVCAGPDCRDTCEDCLYGFTGDRCNSQTNADCGGQPAGSVSCIGSKVSVCLNGAWQASAGGDCSAQNKVCQDGRCVEPASGSPAGSCESSGFCPNPPSPPSPEDADGSGAVGGGGEAGGGQSFGGSAIVKEAIKYARLLGTGVGNVGGIIQWNGYIVDLDGQRVLTESQARAIGEELQGCGDPGTGDYNDCKKEIIDRILNPQIVNIPPEETETKSSYVSDLIKYVLKQTGLGFIPELINDIFTESQQERKIKNQIATNLPVDTAVGERPLDDTQTCVCDAACQFIIFFTLGAINPCHVPNPPSPKDESSPQVTSDKPSGLCEDKKGFLGTSLVTDCYPCAPGGIIKTGGLNCYYSCDCNDYCKGRSLADEHCRGKVGGTITGVVRGLWCQFPGQCVETNVSDYLEYLKTVTDEKSKNLIRSKCEGSLFDKNACVEELQKSLGNQNLKMKLFRELD